MVDRYVDWRHTRVIGAPPEAGARYLPQACKLLGQVFEDAAFNGLGVHKLRKVLDDGTVITAEKHGEIPRITIEPVSSGNPGLRRTVEGFYLSWGSATEDQTPVIFLDPPAPEGDDAWRDWKAMFFNSDAVGYETTPEDRRAGSYIDVFGTKADEPGRRLLPGNGRWTGEDGEVVSWFRGYTSYWPHHYRHPVTNYSNAVSIYGHIAYAVPDPAWRVLAAAKREGWLYVLVAEDLGAIEPPDLPAMPSYAGQVWHSQPFADTAYTYALWRYPLVVITELDTGVETYRADIENAEQLWGGELELAYGAWSFNADCTACVTVQLPRTCVWSWVFTLTEDELHWVPSPVEFDSYPTVEAQRIEISIDHATPAAPVATLDMVLAPTLIAEADGTKLEIVPVEVTSTYVRNDYKMGEFTLPIVEVIVGGGITSYMHRTMIYADLPTRTLLVYRWRTDIAPVRFVSAGFELYIDGVQVLLDDPSAIETGFSFGPYDGPAASNFAMQMAIAFDNGATAWTRPMDAMSYLLGYGFEQVGSISATGSPGQPGAGYARVPHIAHALTTLDEYTLYTEHSAAGGYIFGTVNGPPDEQFWVPDADYAVMYGANHGSYVDDEPSTRPTMGHLGAVASDGENVLAVAGLHPMLGLTVEMDPSALSSLMTQYRHIRSGTNGDAKTLIDGLLGDNQNWRGFTLGHTGKPRLTQRGVFAWP